MIPTSLKSFLALAGLGAAAIVQPQVGMPLDDRPSLSGQARGPFGDHVTPGDRGGVSHASMPRLSLGGPDSALCSVSPWDNYEQAFVCPGAGCDPVTITVAGSGGPISGVFVEIDFSGCGDVCIDQPNSGLSGTTNQSGTVALDPRVGGCEDCPVIVRADGVVIRTYTRVVSPDWDGTRADGRVDCSDLAFFTPYLSSSTYHPCVDVNGDSAVGFADVFFLNPCLAANKKNTTTCFPPLCCVPPPAGMVAWWPLDETTGPTARDIAGDSHGAYIAGAAHVPGQVAGGVGLTSSNQSVAAGDSPNLNFGTGSFSLDAWIRSSDASTTVRTIVDKRDGSPLRGYSLYISSGYLGGQIADGSGFSNYSSPSGYLTDGSWHHVAMTVDRAAGSTGGKLYVDGAVVHTFDPTDRPGNVTNAGDLLIGQAYDASSASFNGEIDEVELFNRALAADVVKELSDAGTFGKCKPPAGEKSCLDPPAGMAAWWPLDEASGPAAAEIAGNSYGTYVGAVTHGPGIVDGGVTISSAGQYVSVGDRPNLNFGTGSFTIDAWIRTLDPTTSVRTIVDKRGDSPLRGYWLYVSPPGFIGFQLADGSGFTNYDASSGLVNDGFWDHVAVTVDRAGGATGGKLYVGGALRLTFDPTVRPGSITNGGSLRIGQAFDGGSTSFNGSIDEIELFNRALSAAEISDLASSFEFGKCKPTFVSGVPTPGATDTGILRLVNNPFRSGHVQIQFKLETEDHVELRVFDIAGRLRRTLVSQRFDAGEHQALWDGTSDDARRVVPGMYFLNIRLAMNGQRETRRLIVLK